jgi:hypothetical protein
MYPPKLTDSLIVCAENLLASLQRGGDHWTGEVMEIAQKDGCLGIALRVHHLPSAQAKKGLVSYVRGYLRESGWKVKSVTVATTHLAVYAVQQQHDPIVQESA